MPSKKDLKKDAEDKDNSDASPKDKPETEKSEEDGGDGKSVAGRKKMKNPKSKEERLVEAEFNQILKRSPGQ